MLSIDYRDLLKDGRMKLVSNIEALSRYDGSGVVIFV